MAAGPSYLRRWRSLSRPARLYLIHAALLTLGLAVSGLFFNLAVVALGFSLEFLGLLNTASFAAAAALSLPLWWLVGRIGLRAALLASALLNAASLLVFALWPTAAPLLLASALGGVAATLFQVSAPPFMMRHSRADERDHLFSANAAVGVGLAGVGSLLAGGLPALLARWLGVAAESALAYRATFAASALALVLALLPLLLIADDGRPTTDDGRPTTDYRQRTTDYRQRTTEDGPPATDDRPPTTDHRPPTTDHRRRRTEDGPPATDDGPPTTDDGSPTTDHRQRTTEDGPPATDDGPSMMGDGPTATDEGPTATDEGPPAQEPSAVRNLASTIGRLQSEIQHLKSTIDWPDVLRLLAAPALISWGAALLVPYLNLFFKQRFGASDALLGLIFAALGIATGLTALGGPLVSARIGKIQTVVLAQALSLPFLLALGAAPLLGLAVGAALLRAALFNMGTPLYEAFAMERTEESARPTVIGLIGAAQSMGYLAAPAISTWVQARYGFAPLFAATATCYALAVALEYGLFVRGGRGGRQDTTAR